MTHIYYSIGIPLPPPLQKILSQFACGIRNAHWHDPAFYHISLHTLGTLDDATVIDIVNALKSIDYHSFFLTLQRPDLFPRDRQTSHLGISLAPSVDLAKIKNLIQSLLNPFKIAQEKKSIQPYIPLAIVPHHSNGEIDRYIFERADWSYTPFFVKTLALFCVHETKKNIFCDTVQEFPLGNPESRCNSA